MATDATDLEAGTIIRKGDTEFQLVDDPDLGTVATEIGDRELTAEQAPDVGDDCLRPQCDGHVTDVNEKRWCSEGCLDWMRTTPQDDDPCDRYVDLADAHTVGQHAERFCDECYGRWLRMQYAGE